MINFLSSWVKNLSFALIIVSILEMLLPNNKTKKYVKMIMGLYILFSIISPFIEKNNEFSFDYANIDFFTQYVEEASSISDKVDQTSMDNRLNVLYEEELQKDIIQKVGEKGYEVESCKVDAHISQNDSGIEKINLKINKKTAENESEQEGNTIESKIVTEIQKIQKVDVDNTQESTNITKTDIKIIKDFLINEYGVNEKCLKIS